SVTAGGQAAPSTNKDVSEDERAAGAMLDQFYSSGAVSINARMSINELLNPAQERETFVAALYPNQDRQKHLVADSDTIMADLETGRVEDLIDDDVIKMPSTALEL
ncbi:hypothetical protein CF327_g7676, partial [Tilletia walkeri]